jgi:peroxiredoxin
VTPPTARNPAPAWTRRWLQAAGAYNLLWGAAVIAAPHALFDWAGMERMRYPQIWQCVGMIVGVYGIAYLLAAGDSRTYWPIVLVGLLGKIFGPLGFVFSLAQGEFPPRFAVTLLTNDLLWWIPFAMMLWDAARSRDEPGGPAPDLEEALDGPRDQHGASLRTLSAEGPVLVVLLRHAGCTFCREALGDLAAQRERIRDRFYAIAVVTMSDHDTNAAMADRYDLSSASWISDPDRILYRALELGRGRFLQMFGPRVFARGFVAFVRGHGLGRLDGDGFQMPGAFVIDRGKVVRAFRHERSSDRPDLLALACEVPA